MRSVLVLLIAVLLVLGTGVYLFKAVGIGYSTSTYIMTTTVITRTITSTGIGYTTTVVGGTTSTVSFTTTVITTTTTTTLTSVPVQASVSVKVLDEDGDILVHRVFGLSIIGGPPRMLVIEFNVPNKDFIAYPSYTLRFLSPLPDNATSTPPPLPPVRPPGHGEPIIYPLAVGEGIAGYDELVVKKDLLALFRGKEPGYYDVVVRFPVRVGDKLLLQDKYVRLTFKWTGEKLELLQVYVP